MKQRKNRQKGKWKQWIPMAFFVAIGAVCGVTMVHFLDASIREGQPLWQGILSMAGMFAAMVVAIYFQLIVHEGGHLVFGLLTGYRFGSFRILQFMWVKEADGIRCRRMTLAGTGGQCLMSPPDMVDGKLPVVWYNLGGALMNVIVSLLCLVGFYAVGQANVFTCGLLVSAIVGIAYALLNGIPMRMGGIDNDGYNALSMGRNEDSLRAFWVQLKVAELTARGLRLKDMPEEWFTVPSDEQLDNSMCAAVGVFACNRLMDEHRFGEADQRMAHLLGKSKGMIGIYRSMLLCDRFFCQMMGEGAEGMAEAIHTKEQEKFRKSMKTNPSILRTEYVDALLWEKNPEKAEQVKARFEKTARTYPYAGEIQAERELMALAEERIRE